ncbi:MAG: J domain-containing protein [Myxococcales bacterium]|nr:J domain-containing protein [Myxococcales bacterium]MCB9734624.1 J domain-containing protein [Deltaproteobacteria bacterium]
MSNIFERLARLARAEFNHMKAVISDRDDDATDETKQERLERLRRAKADLEAAEAELKRAQEADGASAWGSGGGRDESLEAGASAWGRAEPAPERQPTRGAAVVFTQEVRLAYAALELPLGSDRDAVDKKYRELLSRYHPDKHAQRPELQSAANELTRRLREARETLHGHLDRAG